MTPSTSHRKQRAMLVASAADFLAASKIVQAEDYDGTGKSSQASLRRSIADAAPMAALTCIVYHNTKDEDSAQPEKDAMIPHPSRRWELNKEEFLCGMIACAGRRHALGVEDSGCQTSRKGRQRQSSFSDWKWLRTRVARQTDNPVIHQ
jgi:hypothetical protein